MEPRDPSTPVYDPDAVCARTSPRRQAPDFTTCRSKTSARTHTLVRVPCRCFREAARGTAICLSSIGAPLTPPWPMLGAYATSKAALDKLAEVWRGEHPDVGFTCLAAGDCAGGEGGAATEFARTLDAELFAESLPVWLERGYMSGGLIAAADLVETVAAVLRLGPSASLPTATIAPCAPAAGPPGE